MNSNQCPYRMSDGRHFTSYLPKCMNIHDNDPLTSFEYKEYLVKNGQKIIDENRMSAYKANQCGPCMDPYNTGTMLPEQSYQICNKNTCKIVVNEQNGLGLGRDYGSTKESKKIQNDFIARKENEQLYSRSNCKKPTEYNAEDYEGYYPTSYLFGSNI